MNKNLTYLVAFALFISLWEICADTQPAFAFLCPSPTKIVMRAMGALPLLGTNAWYTMQGILGGYLLACGLAICFAILMGLHRSVQAWLYPIFIFIQCTPMFALAPLVVLWLGWGVQATVVPTALTIFFPLTLAIYQGIRSTPKELLEQFVLHQATLWQTLFKLRVPYALPHIFSGLKIAMSSAGFAAVAGEWVGAQAGLGILMLESRRNYDMELAFAALFVLTVITFGLFQMISLAEAVFFARFRIDRQSVCFSKKWCLLLFPLLCLPFRAKDKSSPEAFTLLLDWTPNPNHVPLFVGVAKGFFQEQKINLHLQKNHESSSVIPHLLFERADYTLHHLLGLVKAVAKGAPIQVVGRVIDHSLQGFLYREEDDINSFQDLNGRILGFCLSQPGKLTALLQHLEQHGVVPSAVRNVSADLISPMLSRQIDFLYGAFYNIEGVHLSRRGMPVNCFVSDMYGMPTGPQLVIVAKKGTQAASPDVVARMRIALEKSMDFCRQFPNEAFNLYLQETKDIPKIVEDERAQWRETLPLIAESQQPFDQSLLLKLSDVIVRESPELCVDLNELYGST